MASPWLIARQVRQAIRNDQPEEAERMLRPLLAEGHSRSWELAEEIAQAYVRRAERALRQDDPEAAWEELLRAERLPGGAEHATPLRHTLTRYGLAKMRAALEAGKPLTAVDEAERLHQRGVRHPDIPPLLEAAQDWYLATESADRGDFLLAQANLSRVRPRLSCPTTGLDAFEKSLQVRHEQFRHAVAALHDRAEAQDWPGAIAAADEALAAAPAHQPTRQMRRKAWSKLQPESQPAAAAASPSLAEPIVSRASASAVVIGAAAASLRPELGLAATTIQPITPLTDDEPPLRRVESAGPPSRSRSHAAPRPAPLTSLPKRFLLWVNNAGGYLVCLSPRITLGQGHGEGPVDVPLLAELSRLHAELQRDGEGYVIQSQQGVTVNGQPTARAVLRSGDRVTLGPACQFVFQVPAPLSPTARLEFVSGHHFPLAVSHVILMADSLLIGADGTAHVCVPGVKAPVVLYRSEEGLGVSVSGPFRVENEPCRDRAAVPIPGWVHGKDFGFGIEPFGPL